MSEAEEGEEEEESKRRQALRNGAEGKTDCVLKKTLLYNRRENNVVRDKQSRIIWIRMDYFCRSQLLKQ